MDGSPCPAHAPDARPSAAEIARTLAGGHGVASIRSADSGRQWPVLHYQDGPDVCLLVAAAALAGLGLRLPGDGPEDDASVLLTIDASAPLPDLTLPRVQVTARGRVRPLRTVAAPGAGLDETASGPTMCLLRFDVADWHVHLPAGCRHLEPEDVASAGPDPTAAREGELLELLRHERSAGLCRLVRRSVRPDGRARPAFGTVTDVRPVGLDRYGLTLLCRWDDDDVDAGYSPGLLRLPFREPCDSPEAALAAVGAMVAPHLDSAATVPG